MLYAGGPERKEEAAEFIKAVGWEPMYVGPIRYARNLEVRGAGAWLRWPADASRRGTRGVGPQPAELLLIIGQTGKTKGLSRRQRR